MKRWLHWLLRIENNMSPFSIKHHTSWNESESFEPQFTVFFAYKITASWVGTSKFGRINCIKLTGNWENIISIFSHEEPPYYCRNSKSNTCTFWVPLLYINQLVASMATDNNIHISNTILDLLWYCILHWRIFFIEEGIFDVTSSLENFFIEVGRFITNSSLKN